MRWTKVLLLVAVGVAVMVSTTFAAPKNVKYDANGNAWNIDPETAATPGAGSGEGDVIDQVETRNKFDLQLALRAVGSPGDDDTSTESALAGVTGFYRPSPKWRIGMSMQWDAVDNTAIHFTLPVSLQLFPNPWRDQIFWINANLLPIFTVRTGTEGDFIRESALSWIPSAGMSVELPMGETASWSTEFGVGAGLPITVEGVSDEALNSAVNQVAGMADFKVNFRFR